MFFNLFGNIDLWRSQADTGSIELIVKLGYLVRAGIQESWYVNGNRINYGRKKNEQNGIQYNYAE